MSQAGYTPIQLYYSTTAAAAPSAGNLAAGELAVNITDGKLFYKDNGGVVRVLATAAGSAGDVVGPGSSTDNALVRFDGTTGKLVQNSVGVLSDAGALSGLASVAATTFTGALTGNASTATTLQTSRTIWGQSFDGSANVTGALTGVTDLTASGSLTLSAGTANGVAYLNGSKVLTTGSALTFDGTELGFTRNSSAFYRATESGAGVVSFFGSYLGVNYIGTASNHPVAFYQNGSEQMRLTSTGLGIGTSSVTGARLKVSAASAGGAIMSEDTTGSTSFVRILGDVSSQNLINWQDGTALRFATSTQAYGSYAERMRLDSSGNLGLGVTPSAWTNSFGVIQGLGGWSISHNGANSNSVDFLSNAYRSGGANTYLYVASANATRYQQIAGVHAWYTAPSGTAGNAISFTQAMTLNASAELNIDSGTSGGRLTFSPGSSSNNLLSTTTGFSAYNALRVIASDIRFETGSSPSERARIDSSGNLRIGTTAHLIASNRRLTVFGQAGTELVVTGTTGEPCAEMWQQATSGNNVFTTFNTEASLTQRGSITYNRAGGLTVYNTTSDYRAKDVYGPVVDSGAVIDSVPVYMGKMKGATQERPMFIAHETPPYAHTGEKDAVDADDNPVYQQMDNSALVPVMWAEIQSLRKRLAAAGI